MVGSFSSHVSHCGLNVCPRDCNLDLAVIWLSPSRARLKTHKIDRRNEINPSWVLFCNRFDLSIRRENTPTTREPVRLWNTFA